MITAIWQLLSRTHMSPVRAWKWKWSNGVEKSESDLQGVPKKMQHSDFSLRSVLEVRFNFFTYVSESEFRARSIWAHYRPPIQNLKCPKTLKMHARTLIFPHPSEVKPELCRLCTSSPIPICVGRHYYSWSTLNWVLYLHCTVICDHQSWKWTENWIISSSKHAK